MNDNDGTPDPEPAPQAPVAASAGAIVAELPTTPATTWTPGPVELGIPPERFNPEAYCNPRGYVTELLARDDEADRDSMAPASVPAQAVAEDLVAAPVPIALPLPADPGPERAVAPREPVPPPPPPRTRKAPAAASREAIDLEALTDGQRVWLAGLTAEQRAVFEAKSPKAQAALLGPHRDGRNTDPTIVADQAPKLAPRVAVAVAPPMPLTVEGMWEELPGAPATWPPTLAEMMCRRFGAAENRRYWPGYRILAHAVWGGRFPAWRVLDALRQSAKSGVRNPAAVFNHALRNDHGWSWGKP